MKNITLLLFSFFTVALLTNCKTGKKSSEEKNKVVITPEHVNIPGTHVYMIPPRGFKPIEGSMKGFVYSDERTMIYVMELPGKSFVSETANTIEKIKAKGFKILKEERSKIGEYDARWIKAGDSNNEAWQLVVGNDSLVAMVIGVYSTIDPSWGNLLRDCFNSVVIDKNLKVDQAAGLTYSIQPNLSNYKHIKTNMGFSFYSLNGDTSIKSRRVPFLIVSQLPRESGSAKDLSETAMESALRNFEDSKVVSKGFINTNSSIETAYEQQATAISEGKEVMIYQAIVVKGSVAIMIQGLVRNDFDKVIDGYKTFTDAVEIK